jgi:putative ABC transport system permease protein
MRFADNELFEVFDFHWLHGRPEKALTQPFTVVLTESLATKYFGDDDAMGQSLTLENAAPLRVTGVIRDLPGNTHLRFSGLISVSSLASVYGPQMLEQWNRMTDFHTYFLLRPDASVDSVAEGMADFMTRHIAEDATTFSGMTLMKIGDIHLRSSRDEEWQPPGSLATVYSFGAIALGILLIACVNFMNLSTARASRRAREVAMRKALGATRGKLVGQFLGETMMVAVVAMLVAMALVELLLPAFSTFVGAELAFDYVGDPVLLAVLLGLTLLVGLVAGSYPAFYLSAFEPARVLKGELTRGRGGILFRNLLVVVQFAIAIALLISLAVVYRQTAFARSIDLGFDKDPIVVLTASPREGLGSQWSAFRQQLLEHPGVENVTASHYTPFMFDDNQVSVRPLGGRSFNRIQWMVVDFEFFETYAIDVLAGRSFSPDFAGDAFPLSPDDLGRGSPGLVLNRAAARLLGWSPEQAVGEVAEVGLQENLDIASSVVGVVSDTHFESVRVPVRAMVYVLAPTLRINDNFRLRHASVRLSGRDLAATLSHIDATWRNLMPDQPITRRFLNDDFEALYQRERRQEVLLACFSGLAILIACVGLFGLAAFSAECRTKEIGVRKAMGGSAVSIVILLTNDFGKLVLAANLLAWPAAYFLMRNWLDNFAYRIDLGPLMFLGAAAVALGVAWLTVAGIATRAARANPVHALRYE